MKKFRMYYDYFKYILEHKKNVFIECWKEGLYIHAFSHDLSKFLPSEFFAYAEKFYGDDRNGDKVNRDFAIAWLHHSHRNKHHWNYWVNSDRDALPMPEKYVRCMIMDWKAMSRKFGDTAEMFYLNNVNKMNLHSGTIVEIENVLKITEKLNKGEIRL